MLQIRCKFRPATAEFIYSISSGKSVGVGAVRAVAVAPPVTVPLNFFEDTHGVVQTEERTRSSCAAAAAFR